MAGITQAEAEARLAEYMAAETAVLSNQSYQIGERSLTRANLAQIREGIEYWDGRVKSLARGGRGSIRRAVVHR